jgi:alanyl-tRNA synthetase
LSGELRVGDRIEAAVDAARREAVRNNHSATHLLHASLRQVLGDHVRQSGSLVTAERLRFDFTHFSPLSRPETREVEELVNRKIQENIPVETRMTTFEEGVKEGAVAIFEEKYGDEVRLVSVGDFSRELCGGVHVHSTGEIGLFKIISESSIAAGMRRIEALTGAEALRHVQEAEELLADIQAFMSSPRKDILSHLEKWRLTLDERDGEIKSLRQKLLLTKTPAGDEEVRRVKGVSVLARRLDGLNMEELRNAADSLKQRHGSAVVILGAQAGDRALLVVSVTKDLAGRIPAERLIREIAPIIGGGGGGRPDFAQAGGRKAEFLDRALEAGVVAVEKLI